MCLKGRSNRQLSSQQTKYFNVFLHFFDKSGPSRKKSNHKKYKQINVQEASAKTIIMNQD